MTRKMDKKISDANFEVTPSSDFVDRVMNEVSPSRFAWLKPYAFAIPVFAMLMVAIPSTRNAILDQMNPNRVVAASVDTELEEISRIMDDLQHDFADVQLENLDQ